MTSDIVTERLRLRPLQPADAEDVLEIRMYDGVQQQMSVSYEAQSYHMF